MRPTGMLQRCWEHDYCAPSFYMVTVVTEPRRACLSVVNPGAAPAPGFSSLWQEGYQDTILLHRGQLRAMANYIADNPRRLALKRANPELFTVVGDRSLRRGASAPRSATASSWTAR